MRKFTIKITTKEDRKPIFDFISDLVVWHNTDPEDFDYRQITAAATFSIYEVTTKERTLTYDFVRYLNNQVFKYTNDKTTIFQYYSE